MKKLVNIIGFDLLRIGKKIFEKISWNIEKNIYTVVVIKWGKVPALTGLLKRQTA